MTVEVVCIFTFETDICCQAGNMPQLHRCSDTYCTAHDCVGFIRTITGPPSLYSQEKRAVKGCSTSKTTVFKGSLHTPVFSVQNSNGDVFMVVMATVSYCTMAGSVGYYGPVSCKSVWREKED